MGGLKTLLFIRHGETDLAGTFCGQSDPSLNDAGHAQALAVARELADVQIDIVLSSDLIRAAETAKAIAPATAHLLLPALREIDFGRWEGLCWAEIEARDPAYAARWVAGFPVLPAPGGELFASFRERVLTAVSSLQNDERWRHAAVVTHAGVMHLVLEELAGYSPAEAWEKTREYCSYFVYPEVRP